MYFHLQGPVQTVVVNFNHTGLRTATDSLLCPNTIYTFYCEISGDELWLRSRNSDGSRVNSFTVLPPSAAAGVTNNQTEFNFTALNPVNGLAATAVMNSSMNLSSVQLECRDSSDGSSSRLGTVVNRGKCGDLHVPLLTFVIHVFLLFLEEITGLL